VQKRVRCRNAVHTSVNSPFTEAAGIVVPKAQVASFVRQAKREGIVSSLYVPISMPTEVVLPLTREGHGLLELRSRQGTPSRFDVGLFQFRPRVDRAPLKDVWREFLSPEDCALAPRGFARVGTTALIRVRHGLRVEVPFLASLIKRFFSVETVRLIDGPTHGAFSTRGTAIIAGRSRSIECHIENGCRFFVDLDQTFFNPRLAKERERNVHYISTGENLLCLCVGVGPIPITIAKHNRLAGHIVAVEKNPVAFSLLEKNMRQNGVAGRISAFLADATSLSLRDLYGRFDKAIVAPPRGDARFIRVGLENLRAGGKMRCYLFSQDTGGSRLDIEQTVRRECSATSVVCVDDIRKIHGYSRFEALFAVDVTKTS
jgi:tRNA G37 N-methylase Trm5